MACPLQGYVAGCGSSAAPKGQNIYKNLDSPTLEHFLLINAWGDLYQIASAFSEPAMNSRFFGQNRKDKLADVSRDTLGSERFKLINRCSALIKLLPDFSDVVYGHNTWDTFESMAPRILKHYSFPLMSQGVKTQQYEVHFSSSPAVLSSVDDFFTVTGYSQLGVIETTNNLYNVTLLDLLTPKVRVIQIFGLYRPHIVIILCVFCSRCCLGNAPLPLTKWLSLVQTGLSNSRGTTLERTRTSGCHLI
jgi:hypothetical protein